MRAWLTILLIMTTNVGIYAQEGQFSQYYSSSLFLNPAFAGIGSGMSLSLNHKQQPQNLDVTNQLSQFSLAFPIYRGSIEGKKLGGVGITVFNESQGLSGAFQSTGALVTAAYTFKFDLFGPEFLVFGVQGGYTQRSIDFDNLIWGSQYSPFIGFDPSLNNPSDQFNDQIGFPVLNIGALYYFNPDRAYLLYQTTAFFGFNVRNIVSQKESFVENESVDTPLSVGIHGGFEYIINGKLRWAPNLLLNYFDGNLQTNIGNYFLYDIKSDGRQISNLNLNLVGGIWYRVRDSFIFLVGISKNKYRVGLSYDLNRSFLNSGERNDTLQPAFEISFNYNVSKSNTSRKFSNPLF